MTEREHPGTVTVRLIRDECVRLIEDRGASRLHPDQKIMLAALMFADDEGIARLEPGQLQRCCTVPGHRRSTLSFVQRRIDSLIEAGVLAPGSTPDSLRSMFGRGVAEVELEGAA